MHFRFALLAAALTAACATAPSLAPECAQPHTSIADARTRAGADVVTQGVVVGDYEGTSGLGGFYLQADSAAIFVANADRDDVGVGDRVRVSGTVAGDGVLRVVATSITACGAASITPVDLVLPIADPARLARLEGMLVRVPQTLYVAEHYQLGRYGEVVLASGAVPVTPTQVVEPGAPARAAQEANDRNRIILDDASLAQNPDAVFGRGGAPLSADNTLRVGDTVTGLTGVLTRTSAAGTGPPTWRIRPFDANARVDFVAANARPLTPPDVGGSLRIASFNVLNYFNSFGDACAGGCRGADDAAEFERQAQKIVAAIVALDAAIVGVLEIENDGYGETSAIADLVRRLNGATSPERYAFIDADAATGKPGALGTDAIKVAMLYQPARVTPTGRTAVLADPSFVNAGDSEERNRPALAQAFTYRGGRVVVSVNHFKSKGSPCDAPDPNDGQGNCNAVRTRAANTLMDWLATDPTGTGEQRILVIGDLNSYGREDPIRAFRERGYVDLLGPTAYTYVFSGQRGTLDHALASPALAPQVTGAAVWHINADEPPVLDYNTNFKSASQRASLFRADPFRSSDHDPVLVGIR